MKYDDLKNNIRMSELCGHKTFEYTKELHENRVSDIKSWIKPDCKILDLGCGSSMFFLLLKEIEPTIIPYGLDYLKEAIDASKNIFKEHSDNFIYGSVAELDNFQNLKNTDIALISVSLLCEPVNWYVLEWLSLNSKNIFIYHHEIPSAFNSLRSIVLNFGYDCIQISNNTVKLTSKINIKNTVPSLDIRILKNLGYIFIPFDNLKNLDYMSDRWEQFHKKVISPFFIKKENFYGVVSIDDETINDLFILEYNDDNITRS